MLCNREGIDFAVLVVSGWAFSNWILIMNFDKYFLYTSLRKKLKGYMCYLLCFLSTNRIVVEKLQLDDAKIIFLG